MEHGAITRATRFVWVAVGQNQRDQRSLSQVRKKFENSGGCLFVRYSGEWADFLIRLSASLFYRTISEFLFAQFTQMTIVQLAASVNNGAFSLSRSARCASSPAYPLT